MMTVDTIILDEFDQLLSDSQYHFVDKIIHYVPSWTSIDLYECYC